MVDSVKVLIVDDEPIARRWIRSMLAQEPRVQVIGESGDGAQAVRLIEAMAPDLVFLDIQMPGLNGIEVIRAIGVEKMPTVVFVTAYDEYAVKAFEVHAQDYLLKPLDRERFLKALDRALREVGHLRNERLTRARRGLEMMSADSQDWGDRVLVKSAGRRLVLRANQIDWIEAAGNYVKIHVALETHFHRETLKHIADRLARFGFIRIHRRTVVNCNRISGLKPSPHGDHELSLHDGTVLRLSRRYRQSLESRLSTIK